MIYIHRKKYQERLISTLRNEDDLMISGDGRHESMGHRAKYCAYTIFCCTVPFIVHFTLVQVCFLKQGLYKTRTTRNLPLSGQFRHLLFLKDMLLCTNLFVEK